MSAQPKFTPLRFDSKNLDESEQFADFAAAMANFDMSRPGVGAFDARALVWRIGSLVVTQFNSDSADYDRSSERLARDHVDHFYVNLHMGGRVWVTSEGRRRMCGPGSLVVVDMRQPCRLETKSLRAVSIAIPRHRFIERIGELDVHGLVAHERLAPLLHASLRTLCATLPRLDLSQQDAIERMIMDLVADTLLDSLRAAAAQKAREEALASRLRDHIERNLGNDLNVATICAALGVSRSALYGICGDSGGVLRQVQARRLQRIHRLLRNPDETRAISELARMTGFIDKSHFTRAFKKAYGLSPGAFRDHWAKPRTIADPATASKEDAPHLFRTWLRALN